MSSFKVVQTQMQDQALIVEALERLCPEFRGKIIVSNKPIQLIGHGTATANIVIRSKDMRGQTERQGYADMGLRKVGNQWEWVISDCDQGNYEKDSQGQPNPAGHYNSAYGKYGEAFQGDITAIYGALEGMQDAGAVGWQATSDVQVVTDETLGVCRGIPVDISEEEYLKLTVGQ